MRAGVERLVGGAEAALVAERVAALVGAGRPGGSAEEASGPCGGCSRRSRSEQPLVVVFDDINWAEPTLLDLIEHVADWTRDAPLLLVCMARPELLDARGPRGAAASTTRPRSSSSR